MLTIPNALAPSQDEFTIAALLSESSVRRVADIQRRVTAALGDAVWIAPENCLHITLMEVICDADYGNQPRKQLFSDWYSKYNETAKEIIGRFPSFTLAFDELHVSPAAIIMKANNPELLNNIRTALLAKTVLPKGTKLPPDIGHCTIARFNKAIALEDVTYALRPINVHINEKIKNFMLVEGLAPPRFSPETITGYPLRHE